MQLSVKITTLSQNGSHCESSAEVASGRDSGHFHCKKEVIPCCPCLIKTYGTLLDQPMSQADSD